MGYNTDFQGGFECTPPLTPEQRDIINEFSRQRHNPQDGFPSYYCQWIATDDGTAIMWDGNEKFYNYVEWLQWLIDNMLADWGAVLNGRVRFRGESFDDIGAIVVEDNAITTTKVW